MYKSNPAVKAAAQAALKAAARKGCDPYNTSAAAATHYPRIAALRSEHTANRLLAQ